MSFCAAFVSYADITETQAHISLFKSIAHFQSLLVASNTFLNSSCVVAVCLVAFSAAHTHSTHSRFQIIFLNALYNLIASLSAVLASLSLVNVSSVNELSNFSVALSIPSFIKFMKFSGHQLHQASQNTLSNLLKNFSVVAAFTEAQAQ
jgi:hypothetical protein